MDSPHKHGPGLKRVIGATRVSFAGLAAAFRHEPAFRLLVLLVAIGAPLGLFLGRNSVERVLLIASVLLPLVAELVNAAVEATVDRISLERHPLAGRAKDLGSAAVMLSLAIAALVWALILLDR